MRKREMRSDMRDLKALLFDADGTLIDTQGIILTSMRHTLNDMHGYGYSDEQLMHGVGTPLLEQMIVLANGDEKKAETLVKDYREHNDSIHDAGIKSFPGAKEALAKLQAAGYKMGVVTSKRHEMAEKGLRLTGILGFFDFVIGSDDWPEHKPEPGPILHGCDLLGIPSIESAYIGDSPYDIQAGNAAGCVTYAALWGMFPAELLKNEHPAFCCDSMTQLAAMLC